MNHAEERSVFEEGELAFDAECELDDCPYDPQDPRAVHWIAGFEAAQWQATIEGEGQREDHRLDDPHRGAI